MYISILHIQPAMDSSPSHMQTKVSNQYALPVSGRRILQQIHVEQFSSRCTRLLQSGRRCYSWCSFRWARPFGARVGMTTACRSRRRWAHCQRQLLSHANIASRTVLRGSIFMPLKVAQPDPVTTRFLAYVSTYDCSCPALTLAALLLYVVITLVRCAGPRRHLDSTSVSTTLCRKAANWHNIWAAAADDVPGTWSMPRRAGRDGQHGGSSSNNSHR